jgi:hypothetical protein
VANDDGSVIFYYCCDNLLGLPTSLALSSLHRLRSYFSRVIPPAVWPETWSESDDRLYTVLIRANPTAASLEIWKRYVALPSVTMWGCQEQPDHRELLGLDLPPVHVGQESSRAHSIQKKNNSWIPRGHFCHPIREPYVRYTDTRSPSGADWYLRSSHS